MKGAVAKAQELAEPSRAWGDISKSRNPNVIERKQLTGYHAYPVSLFYEGLRVRSHNRSCTVLFARPEYPAA